jgi:hypothetical protein
MAINATTLSGAVGANDTSIGVVSATGITAPNFTTGVGVTYLFSEQELMQVLGLAGTVVSVARGWAGTVASAHASAAPIISGNPSDFAGFAPATKATIDSPPASFTGFSAAVAGANVNVASGALFHLTGTVIMKTLTAPAGYVEGGIIRIVFDGSAAGLTWDATGNIAVAGTATTAASFVEFVFDSGSGKWHPSRLA